MYAEIGNPPSFNYDVSSERQKLSVWAAICGNGTQIDDNVEYINFRNH